MSTRWFKKFDMFSHCNSKPACDRQTETNRQTSCSSRVHMVKKR